LDLKPNAKKLFFFDFNTQKWSDWVTDAVGIGYITWTADSRNIRYDSGNEYKQVRVGSNHPGVLFSVGDLKVYVSEVGRWGDDAPDGSRMYVRDTTTRDVTR
jgi:hypothetical protein